MIGAIAGDIIGSIYEFRPTKDYNFPLFSDNCTFTDDTVLTIAVADSILNQKPYADTFQDYYKKYPNRGYGGRFDIWARRRENKPYNSYGNGSAMRVAPVSYISDSLDEVLQEAEKSAEVTHNHPEGIKGAKAVAAAIYLAKHKNEKIIIKKYIIDEFGYNLNKKYSDIQEDYGFDETCQGTVPEAIISFLESNNYEDAIRKAIILGGDADTLACITGSIAGAYYGVPKKIREKAMRYLDETLLNVIRRFEKKFNILNI